MTGKMQYVVSTQKKYEEAITEKASEMKRQE